MSVYNKLVGIQTELKCNKGQYNSFGKYYYRSCEDILESLKPVASKYGCAILITDNIELIGDRYYVKATARLIDSETGEIAEAYAYAREEDSKKGMDSSQLTGATSSYARKYALNGLFGIDDTKDSDSTNTHGKTDSANSESKPVQQSNAKTISEAQQKRLFGIAKGNTDLVKEIVMSAGYNSSKDIPMGDVYNKICEDIEKRA